ncbi:MAG: hypothetical protein LIO37_04235 [Clostridiales bacterium]|nr:hypothetical protein [Clostridiales bacterium]
MHPKAKALHPHTKRIYVRVTSDTDPTGYVQPTSITWTDGRTLKIDQVKDFRPAGTAGMDLSAHCYTVIISGQEKHLFFERTDPNLFKNRIGRWYVEVETVE